MEVFLFAVVRSRRHQQQMPRQAPQQARQVIALGVLDLAAKEGGGELVRFVEDHQVPTGLRRLQLLLHILVARQLVQPRDDQGRLGEPVSCARRLQLVVGEDLERQLEATPEFVLPLLSQTSRADHKATLQIPPRHQLLDKQAGHDGLAGAGVVRQQEAQGLARQHGLVHSGDLVRQRIDQRRMNREQWVEQVGQADAVRLGHQPEQVAATVEAPWPTRCHDLQARLVMAVEQLVAESPLRCLVCELEPL